MIQRFNFEKTTLNGLYKITPFHSLDNRGEFIKDYNQTTFKEFDINLELKEVFYTVSNFGVIRAIHFQKIRQQAKLVRCISGHIYDVVVDLRPDSPTFGKWEGFELTGENEVSLYIPEYFGHGYLVLQKSIVSYKCSEEFYPPGDSGIKYDDPFIGVLWPFEKIGGIKNLIISDKDLSLMSFNEYTMQINP